MNHQCTRALTPEQMVECCRLLYSQTRFHTRCLALLWELDNGS
jgi:hypothetical protein